MREAAGHGDTVNAEVFGKCFHCPTLPAQLNEFCLLGGGEQPVWPVAYVVGTLTGLFGVSSCNKFR